MSRVRGDRIALDKSEVAQFFEHRAQKFNADAPLTTTLYQDSHPEIAEKRDQLERMRAMPLLELSGTQRVLDVGCGIGRWAAAVSDDVADYQGIDASPSLIALARDYCVRPNVTFQALGVDGLTDQWLATHGPFDRVICSGILIYLDDEQVAALLAALGRHLAPGAIVYLREPTAVTERLTLSGHWSDELQAHYSAIYRSRDEMAAAFLAAFPPPSYAITPLALLFEEAELNNRAETRQFFSIVKKIG
jgi:2-polyprenyl-3-methyl-5-hydroxy-6-metoxy-1,4-benzoquinol methylase